MDFLDNSGHIFSLPSYDIEPLGYKYDENQYTFWMDNGNNSELSVNNYYTKIINAIIYYNSKDIESIDVSIDSQFFKLLSTTDIQDAIQNLTSIHDTIQIENMLKPDESEDNRIYMRTKLQNTSVDDDPQDLLCINTKIDDEDACIVPIYVIGRCDEEGTWSTNIMIHYVLSNNTEHWCPITVGGTFIEQIEELIINGQNMGVSLPIDILKAVYSNDINSTTFDETLYNQKLKEYMMNYMQIKGECGNFDSAISSLKWFGYGDKITISKLLQTDNEVKTQFLHDYFDIYDDILDAFKVFRNSTYIALRMHTNSETGEKYPMDISKTPNPINPIEDSFFGEGKPILEDLIHKVEKVKVEENYEDEEALYYYKMYFDYSLNDLALKLICLKYYYEKYFLPIHIKLHSATVDELVFANDIKLVARAHECLIEPCEFIFDRTPEVVFNNNKCIATHYLTKQIQYVDENFNAFTHYISQDAIENENIVYYINDTCVNIPIHFDGDDNKYYNCVLILEKYQYNAKFPYEIYINQPIDIYYDNVVILNTYNSLELLQDDYDFAYSIDNEKYSDYIHGYANFKDQYFHSSHCDIYDSYSSIEHTFFEIQVDDSAMFNIVKFYNNGDIELLLDDTRIVTTNVSYEYISTKGVRRKIVNNTTLDSLQFNVYYFHIPYIKIKYNENTINSICAYPSSEISDIEIQYNRKDTKEKLYTYSIDPKLVNIKILDNYELIYESHFNFIQTSTNKYSNFVIYPRLLNKEKQLNYWISNDFRIRLLVNDKWYDYPFKIIMPAASINMYKLEYDYYTENSYGLDYVTTNFDQISYIDDSSQKVVFNSYMHHPKAITINNILYPYNFNEWYKFNIENSIRYIDNTFINAGDFYFYIELTNIYNEEIHTQKIYMNSKQLKNDISVPFSYLDYVNLWVYYYDNDNVCYIGLEDSANSTYVLLGSEDLQSVTTEPPNYTPEDLHNLTGTLFGTDNQPFSKYENTEMVFHYNSSTKKYELSHEYNPWYTGETREFDIHEEYNNTDRIFKFSEDIVIPNNRKYYNHIIVFDIFDKDNIQLIYDATQYSSEPGKVQTIVIDGVTYEFGDNVGTNTYNLYKDFFEPLSILDFTKYVPKVYITEFGRYAYDFYLMHDFNYWYGVFISTTTIENMDITSGKTYSVSSIDNNFEYTFKYRGSDTQFLINRMRFVPVNGINQFSNDDLIAVGITNNDRIPVNYQISAKWHIEPMSIGVPNTAKVQSNNELAIISLPIDYNKYYSGYYGITLTYSIDNYTSQQFKKHTKFLIR